MTVQHDLQHDQDRLTRDWQEWHEAHEAQRASEHGFLAVTGLYFLEAEPQRIPDAPGAWRTGSEGITVDLGPDESLELDGRTITGTHTFGALEERSGVTVLAGDTAIELAKRGGYDIVRPRVPTNPRRTTYRGTAAFTPSTEWALKGRFDRFEQPRPTTVGAAVDGLEHVYDAVGELRFRHDGAEHALLAFEGHDPAHLLVLFTDETAGVTTTPSVRALPVTIATHDSAVLLDFNRATNLPCAYTPYATCPLPPAQNRLSFPVYAGEQAPA